MERGIGTRETSIEVIETGTGIGILGGETREIEIGRDEGHVRGLQDVMAVVGGTGIGVGIGTGGNDRILASGGISTKAISGGE